MDLTNNEEFRGTDAGGNVSIKTAVGTGTLQTLSASGVWVSVPDGVIADSVISFYCGGDDVMRFTSVTGEVRVTGGVLAV